MRPPCLKPGDTIGIISPSWGGAGIYPHRVQQGVAGLNRLGFRVKIAPNALHQHGFVSDTPANRADDIHALFADPEVKAILTFIAGDHSCHLLPLLDFDLIASHPKIFMGYSDTTVLNIAIWRRTGLVAFNGPAVLTDFAEVPHTLDYTESYFLKAVAAPQPIGQVLPAPAWTEEAQKWGKPAQESSPRTLTPSPGWTWLKPGQAQGTLIGGCIESLQHLRGTPFWPDWQNAIFFFETSEDKPSPADVDGILMDYQNMGVFDQLAGMLVGRPMRYTDEEKHALRERILERTQAYDFPVITDMDFGHTAPQFTLPLGCTARIDSTYQRFEILESAAI